MTILPFARGNPPLVAVTWQEQLDQAPGGVEVMELAREFLASFSPQELAGLPQGCTPPAKLVDPDDVSDYAYELARRNHAMSSQSPELVGKLAAFFSNAAHRLSTIAARKAMEIDGRHSA
jgi:hypothetical protein